MSEDETKNRLGRRIVALRIAAGGAAAVSFAAAEPATAQGVTDRDPSDGPGRGRGRAPSGVTDSDPSDGPGRGRGARTDSDPNDAPGRGRR